MLGLEAADLSVWSLATVSTLLSVGDTSSCCLGSIFTSYLLESLLDFTVRNLGLGKEEGKEMLLLRDLRRFEVLDLILLSHVTTVARDSG